MKFPSRDEIVGINRRHLKAANQNFIYPDNLKEAGSLNWVLEAIQYPIFDQMLYPTFPEKAAQLVWTIIRGHVFWDGCKRTGMSTLIYFTRLNGYQIDLTTDEIIEVGLKVASDDQYTCEHLKEWIKEKVIWQKA